MINKIILKNFRSHKKTILNLCEGINGIIGLPGSGKTNIIRSIELVKDNRPTGFAYHNNITKDPSTEVAIKPDNVPMIRFIKVGSKAKYKYGKTKFEGIGTKPPPTEIQEGLNLNDINFGLQLGMPFLILSSPPEIAREINKVSESEVINKCIKKTNEILNKLKNKKKSLEFDIEKTELKLKPYNKLHKVKPLLDKAKEYDKKIEVLEQKREEIEETVEFIKKARKAIKNQEKPLKAIKYINEAESLQFKMEKLASQMILIEKIKMLQNSLNAAVREKEKLVNEYINNLKQNKRCPTCFSRIKKSTIANIRKELTYEN